MSYRVSAVSRRIWLAGLCGLGVLAVLTVILADLKGIPLADLAVLSVLLIWLITFGFRGWRSATLLASDRQVTVRGMVTTASVQWRHIDTFVTDTRPTPLPGLPFRRMRTVLGIRLRTGQTRWFPELSCRPADGALNWVDISIGRLNEMLAMQSRP
jgi:hypothetical protein